MEKILEIKNCSMTFKGLKAVRDASLSLEAKRIYGLIGTNGAGKTTIINMLSGILVPTEGKIFFQGEDITGIHPDKIAREGILRTYQNLRLFGNISAIENVIIGAQIKSMYSWPDYLFHTRKYHNSEKQLRDKAMEMLQLMDIDKYAGEMASSLPYGCQRRLEIARILAASPKIILLDEPAAGMNPQESAELVKTIRKVKEKFDLTILLIEHDMKVIMNLCDYIYVMSTGEIIASGTPEEIRNDKKVIAAYLGRAV